MLTLTGVWRHGDAKTNGECEFECVCVCVCACVGQSAHYYTSVCPEEEVMSVMKMKTVRVMKTQTRDCQRTDVVQLWAWDTLCRVNLLMWRSSAVWVSPQSSGVAVVLQADLSKHTQVEFMCLFDFNSVPHSELCCITLVWSRLVWWAKGSITSVNQYVGSTFGFILVTFE